jgi:hypothetical protein
MKNVEDVIETYDSKKSKRNLEFIVEAVKMIKPRKPLTRSTLKENLAFVNEGATEVHISEEVHVSSRKRVMFSQETSTKEKPRKPLTRSATRIWPIMIRLDLKLLPIMSMYK